MRTRVCVRRGRRLFYLFSLAVARARAGWSGGGDICCLMGGGPHDRVVGRGGAAAHTGDDAGLPHRPAAGQQGMRYPADPPTVDVIVAVMRHTGRDSYGWRLRAMVVVLWRAGLRLHEALALAEHDLDQRRGPLLVRRGKGGGRREVGIDQRGWEQLRPWLVVRAELPVGPMFCIIDGRTRGRAWSAAVVDTEFPPHRGSGGRPRRFALHQLWHAHALELAREGVPLNIIKRQLGHANLGTTSINLQAIDPEEIITVRRDARITRWPCARAACQ